MLNFQLKVAVALIVPMMISACASTTGVLPAGPNTYTVTEKFAPVRGGGTEAQRVALTEANEFCQKQDRVFVPTTMGAAGNLTNPYGPTGYSVTFQCLTHEDPAVARYRLQRAPDVVVENRNR
jgi:hypothetical protein